jgi:hypothetical protein
VATQQQNITYSAIIVLIHQVFKACTVLNLQVSVNGIMAELFS